MIRHYAEQAADVACWMGSGAVCLRPAVLGSLS